MIVFETLDFQADIDKIDQFLFGRINQDTWQTEPIEFEGKSYIKHKPILDEWKAVNTTEIELPPIEIEDLTDDEENA